ncbi:R3H domain-containing protein [Fusarium pseudoanthophilum]|uniref:R3H domain-containing protein n=1 Tax=Fusarium pseudoanthophilum TaxID=48495 RepID=A0A8H5PSB7_9HYPO|nr:R3H domain-containing protein [Fusarium pseudoanthophilum]
MATTQMSPDLPKPSFAKVAASVSKDSAPPAIRRIATPSKEGTMSSTTIPSTSTAPVIANGRSGKAPAARLPSPQRESNLNLADHGSGEDSLERSLKDLGLRDKAPNLVVNGSGPLAPERPAVVVGRDSGSDDSQRADSSSELGTKPPSLDGKSITSGTTFALDEKESLRPDDSASVKAAAEDDDAFSVRGSLVAGSRMGSEVAARARMLHLGDIPERRLPQPVPGTAAQGVLTPQSSSSEQPPGAPMGTPGSSDALGVIYRQAPDDKLLEAMASPKDRLFLLRLEKQVIDFVQDSKTPFCRVPTSLALINPSPTVPNSSTPPPVVLPKKIMRRGQDSEGGPSASPSKPTSETGSDAKDKPAANQKLTREEREEQYKLARERIFGSSEDSVTEEGDNGVSRASSVSAKDKSNIGKRGKTGKQRRDDSDSFDSRHQYTPYWGPQQQTWISQPQYMPPPNTQYGAQAPPGPVYPGQVAPVYTHQGPGYPAMPAMPPNQAYPQYSAPPYAPQAAQQRYPSGGSPMTNYGAPAPPVGSQQPAWQPGLAPPTQYQARGGTPTGPQGHMGIPYAYGQLPANINPHDPKSQHPIPGSYNRNHAFNPKTQSFVPGGGGGMAPVQPPQPPFTAPGSHHGSPQVGSPHLAYPGGYQQPMSQPYGGGYGMVRQGSSNSMPAYSSPRVAHIQHAPPPPPVMPQNPPHMAPQPLPPHYSIPNRPNIAQVPSQPFSHLPTYGNPATLPQKPATGI